MDIASVIIFFNESCFSHNFLLAKALNSIISFLVYDRTDIPLPTEFYITALPKKLNVNL